VVERALVKPVAVEVFEAVVLLDFGATVDDDVLFPKLAIVDAWVVILAPSSTR
jgi:hypothetical protein